MTKEEIFKTIKWVVIGIIILLLLKECKSVINTITNPVKPIKDSVVHKTDTIWAKDTVIVFKPKRVFVPQPADTFWKPSPVDTSICHRVFVSRDTFSNKDVDIFTETHYQGLLREIKPSYKLKVPIKIIDSITVYKPTLYPPKFQLGGSVIIGKNIIAPEISGSINRSNFGIGYNILDKSPTIRYSYTIFRK